MARHRLIERRETLKLTQRQVAHAIGKSTKSYQRYEWGETTPGLGRRAQLASTLGWTKEQLAVALEDDGTTPPNGHGVPRGVSLIASLEQGASEIFAFEPVVVHGLLQIEDYATAVESIGPASSSPPDLALKVKARMARQLVLERPADPPVLQAILDESVLHRLAHSREVMARQLQHLAERANRPNIDLRILTFDSGVFSAAFGSFTLYASDDSDSPYTVLTEDRGGPNLLVREPDLMAHIALAEFLTDQALPPTESIDLINKTTEELYR